jgi:hypothetical protein
MEPLGIVHNLDKPSRVLKRFSEAFTVQQINFVAPVGFHETLNHSGVMGIIFRRHTDLEALFA